MAPSWGKAMERPGDPAAGPRVTVTETNWATSGVRPVPLSITSRRRIVCGPEASDKRNAFTLTCEVTAPSTDTSTWPAFGEDGPVPGAVRLKFDTTKTTATGLPFPMTALFAGDTIESVGGDAARAFVAADPEARIRPIVVQTKARVRAFMVRSRAATTRPSAGAAFERRPFAGGGSG